MKLHVEIQDVGGLRYVEYSGLDEATVSRLVAEFGCPFRFVSEENYLEALNGQR
jgi:hypothetical protein